MGGPLLGERDPIDAPQSVLKPIITPPIQLGASKQKLILLPKLKFISILAYQTGKTLGSLVPIAGSTSSSLIESVTLTSIPIPPKRQSVQDVLGSMNIDMNIDSDKEQEEGADNNQELDSHHHLLLVGCRDGTIREFSLNQLDEKLDKATPEHSNIGSYILDCPCLAPERTIRVAADQAIMHLTVPHSIKPTASTEENLTVYALVETKGLHEGKKNQLRVNVSLLRLNFPIDTKEKELELKSKEQKESVDQLSCRVGKSKWNNTVPYYLESVARPLPDGKEGQAIFCVVARTTSIHVYYSQVGSSGVSAFPPISLTISKSNALSACAVSTNGEDICCGHEQGEIKVMTNILSIIEDYHVATMRYNRDFGDDNTKGSDRPDHPSKSVVTAKLHWHSHPVASIAFDGDTASMKDPLFYSGGLEAVLCTWQVSQGNFRPTDVLPRVALGGIVHVVASAKGDGDAPSGILLYCQDNSLQLVESHNKTRLWKVQGIAVSPASTKESNRSILDSTIQADPKAKGSIGGDVILTGLPDAPGFMHWYNVDEGRVSASLEVAPYNRVSRTYRDEKPMPAPRISDHAFSKNGDDLITVDESLTENTHIGALERSSKNGIVSTIRFWAFSDESASDSKVPYQLSAAMTYPHGPKNRVSALAVAPDGSCACTVSNDERAFRVWFKATPQSTEDGASKVPAWSCRYKVTIPAAFSGFKANKGAATFSADASILAIAFGDSISLWDVREGRFLTSLQHWGGDAVESCTFTRSQGIDDLLLTKSPTAVNLQSPFRNKAAYKGWSWGIPEGIKGVVITDARLIVSDGVVAASIYFGSTNTTRIVMIDAVSGDVVSSSETSNLEQVDGCIARLGSSSNYVARSAWNDAPDTPNSSCFYGMTLSGHVLQFRTKSSFEQRSMSLSDWRSIPVGDAPTLDISSKSSPRKRQRVEAKDNANTFKKALAVFGNVVEADSTLAPPASSELPSLSGNFVHAFVGRSLTRRKLSAS